MNESFAADVSGIGPRTMLEEQFEGADVVGGWVAPDMHVSQKWKPEGGQAQNRAAFFQ